MSSSLLKNLPLYGRQDILEIINKRANGLSEGYRQNIALIGEELIGKTYLIQHWLSGYWNNYVVPLYLEVKPQEQAAFPQKFIGTLLYAFLRNSQIPLKDNLDFLIEKAQGYIPNTIQQVKDLLNDHKKRPPQDIFIKLLSLAESFYGETGKRCCIILDEFHRLEEFKIKDLYVHWRKNIMLNKNTMYILISSKKQLATKIITSDLNLLFGNFELIEVGPFSNNIARKFVEDKLNCLKIERPLLDFIIDFNAANPFYLNVICNALLDYHKTNDRINATINSFTAAAENLFLDNWGILNKRFLDMLKDIEEHAKNPFIPKLLVTLANSINRLNEITHSLHRPKKEISQVLNLLESFDLISKTADVYMLCDRIFGFWLKSVYAVSLNSFDTANANQKEVFRKNLQLYFDEFNAAQNKALSERIIELFNQFSNEAVRLQKKHLRLNHFKEVKLLNINGKKIKEGILGRAVNTLWIAGLKEGYAGEEDILEFIDICKKFRHNKEQKKIFIVFDEMDVNARLIAKEKKIITWDISCLNSLLEIYGKPRIVRPASTSLL